MQAISTRRVSYKMNRFSLGIKTDPPEFNRLINQILNGLSNTIADFDGIVVHGKDKDQCSKKLFACLERLREHDLHLNDKKCTFFRTRIEYLGHVVENNKISRSPSKVEVIIRMQQPRNVQELRKFLARFDYTFKFRKGLENQKLDCLSRAPVYQNCIHADVSINDEVHHVCASAIYEISSENLTTDAIV
ncbi:hypothetical protein AVEN_9926-1 [Araneus ventricosus]|uniref:Reverse transcriptase domain-containing protein n=1 Tax=Araneus ventricosus TaxID=182803 RepID=A0A4Y2NAV3_ARAVE|nr:hypothetical protein AVEN_9926-1 [Araneus ventricosus]